MYDTCFFHQSTCHVCCFLAVTLCCEERSGYKNLVNKAAFQEQQNIRAGPCPGGTCQTTEDGLQLCLNLTLGKKLQGAYSCEFDHVVMKYGTGTTVRRKKAQLPKPTLLDSRGVCNADIRGSSEFKSHI